MKRLSILILCTLPLILTAQVAELWNVAPNGGLNRKGLVYKIYGDGSGLHEILSFDSIDVTPVSPLSHHNGKIYGFGVDTAYFIYSIDVASGLFMRLQSLPAPVNKPNTCYFDEVTPVEDELFFSVGTEDVANNTQMHVLAYHLFHDSFTVNVSLNRLEGDYTIATLRVLSGLTHINGVLYGVAFSGGIEYSGTMFKLNLTNMQISKIYDFNVEDNIIWPNVRLVNFENRYLLGAARDATSPSSKRGRVIFQYDLINAEFSIINRFWEGFGYTITGNRISKGYDQYIYGASNGGKHSCTPTIGVKCGALFRYHYADETIEDILDFPTGNSGVFPNGIIYASDGNLYGTTTPFLSNPGFIFKYDIANNAASTLYMITDTGLFGQYHFYPFVDVNAPPLQSHSPSAIEISINVYPNPAEDRLYFKIDGLADEILNVEVIDVLGKTILTQTIGAKDFLRIDYLQKGIYFWRVAYKNKNYGGKFYK